MGASDESSADFMTRNTLKRVEVAAPIYDEAVRSKIRHIFDVALSDNVKGKRMLPDGTIDCIHTTAASHGRVFIVEIMGHKVGHLTLHAGIAGGADIILIPEIPYDLDKVIGAIEKRDKTGKRFTILAVAEGAVSKEDAALSKKEYKQKVKTSKYPSVAYEIADKIKEKTGKEIRIAVPGHTQRGGAPCPYDRVISKRFGAAAAELIIKGKYGNMVAMVNGEIKCVPLSEVAGKLKTVDAEASVIKEAKAIGISFGD